MHGLRDWAFGPELIGFPGFEMHEKRIGGMHVSVTGEKITFAPAGYHEHSVTLGTEFHRELIEFLNAFQIEKPDARVGFRVPLSADIYALLDSEFEARLYADGNRVEMCPKDISLTGISFSVGDNADQCPDVGSEVELDLLVKERIRVKGIVRRRDKRTIGISFESEFSKADFEPPDALIHIVRDLERVWLRMQRNAF